LFLKYIIFVGVELVSDFVIYLEEEVVWFSPGPPVSSTNITDNLDIAEILLKVELKHHDP
jgi:hypothetical protein